MITYKNHYNSRGHISRVDVHLDGKFVGVIKDVATGWKYFPKGFKGGQEFLTISEVKKSLESC